MGSQEPLASQIEDSSNECGYARNFWTIVSDLLAVLECYGGCLTFWLEC